MKYKLKSAECIRIDESAKEDFKKMMGWDDTKFVENTIIVEEKKTLSSEVKDGSKVLIKGGYWYDEDKIKEFIKDIKEDVEKAFAKGCADIDPEETDVAPLDDKEVIEIINKRAGERLT